jgi:mono/diheme cytochrome c family protein
MLKKFILVGSLSIAGVVSVTLMAQAPAGNGKAATKAAKSEARAFVDQYCVGCHGQAAKNAKMESARHITLDDIDIDHPEKDPEKWELVVRKVRAGMMPPAGMRRPEPAAFESWMSNLENALDRTTARRIPAPGLHRLNRTEYANVIRDLLDIKIDPSAYLPSDDSTRGFDNVAAGLSISPSLLEGYVSAAGKISRIALGNVTTPISQTYRVPEDTSQDYHVEGMPLGTRGGIIQEHEFPADGDYKIEVTPLNGGNMAATRAFGEINGERLEVFLDGVLVKGTDWTGNATKYEIDVPVKAGRHTLVVTFNARNFAPGSDLNKHFERSTIETGGLPGFRFFPHIGKVVVNGPYNAKPGKDTAARKKIFVCNPANASQETACATKIVNELARRAYRRPVTVRDTELLLGFFQRGKNEGGSFDAGVEMALRRILSDPEFVVRREFEPASLAAGKTYSITDVELASRLSFFLWSSIPDEELLRVAEQGKLRQQLSAQVKRMLKDPRSSALVDNFAGQWLGIRALATQAPIANIFPNFDENLRTSMRREMELFVASIIQEDRPVTDMLDANYTFVNERLAKHYGIPNVYGSFYRKVELPAELDYRRGVLGKGLFLTISSQPGRTSPVQRGKTVMQTFLGVEPPAPPPNVEVDLKSSADERLGTPTMREQMEMHREKEPCASCHKIMDPIGFSLENFDATGAWRDFDGSKPVDAKGTLVDGTKLNGAKELRGALVKYSPQFVRVTIEKMLIYGLGRGTEYYDMPLVREIYKNAGKDNYRFSALVAAVVASEPFQMNQKLEATGGE